MKEYIEFECGYCGHTEDIECEVVQEEHDDWIDCSDHFGEKCAKCGEEEAMCPVGGGSSHYADSQHERRQMGLSNF